MKLKEKIGLWAIELFCDHGADINTKNSGGQNAMIVAAHKNYDNICMYLSLRTNTVD